MNETAVDALTVHGTNPQFLIEKITRSKIYSCLYWKEKCFGLTAETILDRAVTLKYYGGCYGGTLKPSPFLCLVLKLLQLQPEKEIIIEFIRNDDFKYIRALGAFYLRLVGKAEDVYRYLEPLYNDYRKLSFRGLGSGTTGWQIKHMDEFIDDLLTKELVCDIALPFLQKRSKLEDLGQLQPRKSVLDEELEFMQNQDENEESGNDNDNDNDNDVVAFLDKVTGKENSSNKTDIVTEMVKSSTTSSSSSAALHKDTADNASFDNREKRDENSKTNYKDRNYERDNDRLKSDNNGRDRERDRGRDKERRSRSPERSRRSRSRDRSRRSRSRDRSRRSRSRDRSRSDHKRHDDYDDKRHRRRSPSRSHSRDRRERSRDRRDRSRDRRDRYDDRDYGNRRNRSRSRSKDRYDKYEKPDKSVVNFDDDEEDGQVNETKIKEIEKANKKAAKKFDKIFGKKDTVQSSSKAEQGKVEEGSVEYWNQIRASLGIKALRE